MLFCFMCASEWERKRSWKVYRGIVCVSLFLQVHEKKKNRMFTLCVFHQKKKNNCVAFHFLLLCRVYIFIKNIFIKNNTIYKQTKMKQHFSVYIIKNLLPYFIVNLIDACKNIYDQYYWFPFSLDPTKKQNLEIFWIIFYQKTKLFWFRGNNFFCFVFIFLYVQNILNLLSKQSSVLLFCFFNLPKNIFVFSSSVLYIMFIILNIWTIFKLYISSINYKLIIIM